MREKFCQQSYIYTSVSKTKTLCLVFAVASQVFVVEQFGIGRWKANGKTNVMISKHLKSDAYSPRNREICLKNPKTVQYVLSNPNILLLTSHGLACKVQRLVLTLNLT